MEKNWKEIPIGGVILEPGSSLKYKTGTWRVLRPVLDEEKCVRCMLCWIHCPEGAIQVEKGERTVDLDHCKGCGICAEECPKKAIEMIEEFKLV